MTTPPVLGTPIRYGYTGVHKRLAAAAQYLDWSGASVLDVGCGNGAYTLEIAKRACAVYGIDVVPEHVRELQQRAIDQVHVAAALAAGERLPFPDSCFDLAFCIETLEHVLDEHATLNEIWRVLRPGGTLFLTLPNKWYPFETHGLRVIPWGQYVPFLSWLPRRLHTRWAYARIYTAGDIRQLLRVTGWQSIQIDWMLPPLDMLHPALLRIPLRAILTLLEHTPLRRFGVSLIVAAHKPA